MYIALAILWVVLMGFFLAMAMAAAKPMPPPPPPPTRFTLYHPDRCIWVPCRSDLCAEFGPEHCDHRR